MSPEAINGLSLFSIIVLILLVILIKLVILWVKLARKGRGMIKAQYKAKFAPIKTPDDLEIEASKTPFNTFQKVTGWFCGLFFFPLGLILPMSYYFYNRSIDRRLTQLAILKALNN